MKGEDSIFYSPEEVTIAYNEKKLDLHAHIKVKSYDLDENGNPALMMIDTTCGRVLFNERVPREVGYVNSVLTKKALRDIIGNVLKVSGTARTAQFLDDIKELGYQMAFRGGLSFNLDDIIIPSEKVELVNKAEQEVLEVMNNYNVLGGKIIGAGGGGFLMLYVNKNHDKLEKFMTNLKMWRLPYSVDYTGSRVIGNFLENKI
jgi:DNA-directed RNA polymerase subunit beta'